MKSLFCAAGALLLLTSSALGQASAAAPLNIGETFTIQSKVLGETRRINVYLPPAYSETPSTRLPVMYMPDGGVAWKRP